ncbi:RtcB family protein [Escherichia coli]|nr:RtcB family protein [Escherichia coli]
MRQTCATPDFHPGNGVPVGAVVASTPDLVIPAAIGTDISCGMRLLTTGLTLEQAEANKDVITQRLTQVLLQNERDVPLSAQAFTALFDGGPADFVSTLPSAGLWTRTNIPRMVQEIDRCIGLNEHNSHSRYAPPALLATDRALLRDPCLGTPGSGNHFIELQVVDSVVDRHVAWQQGLKTGDIVVMIHSGSRDVGFYVGRRWMDRARAEWPAGHKHPQSGLYGLAGGLAEEYLQAMGMAARYAWLNRVTIAEMVRVCFADLFHQDDSHLVVDVPHNIILREHEMNIHRKGATPAHAGALALIPGSMGDYTWLAVGCGNSEWLWSCSHGAGRSQRRQAMRSRATEESTLPWQCVTLREERRLEEAPAAYKDIAPVIEAQQEAGLIQPAVRLRPWLTFKG